MLSKKTSWNVRFFQGDVAAVWPKHGFMLFSVLTGLMTVCVPKWTQTVAIACCLLSLHQLLDSICYSSAMVGFVIYVENRVLNACSVLISFKMLESSKYRVLTAYL